tara:strand:- start:321 stop:950 length:630 start_codon:yes stop_codon:yes gene_type:complete
LAFDPGRNERARFLRVPRLLAGRLTDITPLAIDGENPIGELKMNTIKTLIAAAVLAGTFTAAPSAFAIDEYNVSKGTTVDGQGVAFRGNDLVAMANGLGIVPGQATYTHVHDGVAYYFASETAMEQFADDPEDYVPQYGGYCALGVAVGKKLDGSPRFADIVNGKLYVFLNAAVFEAYKKDKTGILAKAAKNWPDIHHVSVSRVNGLGS